MEVKSEREVPELCPTLSNSMDCSLPGYSVHGSFQARVLEWGATAFSLSWVFVVRGVLVLSQAMMKTAERLTERVLCPTCALGGL